MFRSFFIYLSKAGWARNIATHWGVIRRVSSRFISGEKIDDAIHAIQGLNQKNIYTSIDYLGEHTTTSDDARNSSDEIIRVLEEVHKKKVISNVSVKLTQLGLAIDPKLCADNLFRILTRAKQLGNFVRVDMEDASVTQVTLDILYQMRNIGCDNVGIVIQSYLYRSEKDINKLVDEQIPVRLCKGAYKEATTVAYAEKRDVDLAYDRLAAMLLDGAVKYSKQIPTKPGLFPPLPALATHDPKRINFAKQYVQKINLPKAAFEFQMLYGIRRDLQEQLIDEGYSVRVYVPFGTQWYPYYMRRLGERPANVWFILSNIFKR